MDALFSAALAADKLVGELCQLTLGAQHQGDEQLTMSVEECYTWSAGDRKKRRVNKVGVREAAPDLEYNTDGKEAHLNSGPEYNNANQPQRRYS